ncbi:hypothetical protein LC087_11605 [Bacillus carboniphilus]|uniref:Uncharacterized protein n=1 Tax=Bacillus carboniphilus TaxID=86663 RepID=A0ABY9JSQ7_9BACI|nr:hypothetical protein [Bacillus carboniphilus]WLR41533.1 hypothetical protein LC087_11605 [Bacillus carboniphilus]
MKEEKKKKYFKRSNWFMVPIFVAVCIFSYPSGTDYNPSWFTFFFILIALRGIALEMLCVKKNRKELFWYSAILILAFVSLVGFSFSSMFFEGFFYDYIESNNIIICKVQGEIKAIVHFTIFFIERGR